MVLFEENAGGATLQDAQLQDVFEVFYRDGRFLSAYHSTLGSTNVVITDWQGNERQVSFELQLTRAPAIIVSVIGSQVKAIDTQRLTWARSDDASPCTRAEASSFSVSSTPELQMSGGKRFSQSLTISYSQAHDAVRVAGGLEVAANIWGLSGSIEPIMLEEARTQLSRFFQFAQHYYKDFKKPTIHNLGAGRSFSDSAGSGSDLLPASPRSDPESIEQPAAPDGDVLLQTQAAPAQAAALYAAGHEPAVPDQGSRVLDAPAARAAQGAAQRPLSSSDTASSDEFTDVMEYLSSQELSEPEASSSQQSSAQSSQQAQLAALQREVGELRGQVAALRLASAGDDMRRLTASICRLADHFEARQVAEGAAHSARMHAVRQPAVRTVGWSGLSIGAGIMLGAALGVGVTLSVVSRTPPR